MEAADESAVTLVTLVAADGALGNTRCVARAALVRLNTLCDIISLLSTLAPDKISSLGRNYRTRRRQRAVAEIVSIHRRWMPRREVEADDRARCETFSRWTLICTQ